jgi:hypothetical protein
MLENVFIGFINIADLCKFTTDLGARTTRHNGRPPEVGLWYCQYFIRKNATHESRPLRISSRTRSGADRRTAARAVRQPASAPSASQASGSGRPGARSKAELIHLVARLVQGWPSNLVLSRSHNADPALVCSAISRRSKTGRKCVLMHRKCAYEQCSKLAGVCREPAAVEQCCIV